ncbi:MAG: hypothetical protein U5J83_09420 [Bryobacterales bacterium]|nr:hypothetical protein [Bryobacterales bacterium]
MRNESQRTAVNPKPATRLKAESRFSNSLLNMYLQMQLRSTPTIDGARQGSQGSTGRSQAA